jgi:hypothetical protein
LAGSNFGCTGKTGFTAAAGFAGKAGFTVPAAGFEGGIAARILFGLAGAILVFPAKEVFAGNTPRPVEKCGASVLSSLPGNV